MVPPGDKSLQAEVTGGRWEQGGQQLGHVNTEANPHRGTDHQSTEPGGNKVIDNT